MESSSELDEQQIIEMSNRLNNQELRVYQRRLDELRYTLFKDNTS